MAEYIDRDKAVSAACEGADAWDGGSNASRDKYLAEYIGGVPAADVTPVRHGKWYNVERIGLFCFSGRCSVCHGYARDSGKPFCPNCGAKMDGEQE